MKTISEKIKEIKKVIDINYLINEHQNIKVLKDYYVRNKIAYLLFHNRQSFLHMGISHDGRYLNRDLYVQLKEIEKIIHLNGSKKVLELGFGHGANTNYLAKKHTDIQFDAIDISTRPFEKYIRSNTNFMLGDYHYLDHLTDDSYDVIFAIETICHSTNKKKVFDQVCKKLKKRGIFIVYDGYLNKRNLSDEENLSCILVKKGMAVDSFEHLNDVEGYMKEYFHIQESVDLSVNILPTLYRFERLAKYFYRIPFVAKLFIKLLPEKFIRNTFSAYLMTNLVKEKIAVYYKHLLVKE